MSANRLIVTVLSALAAVALAVRVVAGPMPGIAGAESRYAAAKFGGAPGSASDEVQMAQSGAPAAP